MSVTKIFVISELQAEDLEKWFGKWHFPKGVNCYMLQCPLSAIATLSQLGVHGHDARWSDKLDAVIVVVPREPQDVVGREIKAQLGCGNWPSGSVTKDTWKSFGA